ncbi:PRTRC system protein F [Burkholderia pseudomallei]|uniref:PRTRC system protein F n=1 Tax=Burkholderia pseudomallei TaxID=28450 RepID=UPI0019402D44|nr:PRTRC system protein F [Burkholderia pseudomallei]MBM5585035.1 PRTRC system protein F [Burkholderia pseudomallei]
MFFDPAHPDSSVATCSAAAWESPRAAAARRRPAADLLTLPSFSTEVPGAVRLKWREDVNLSDLVLKHFRYGPLRAGDVHDPADAGDAFQQAFHAWMQRQYGRLSRLRFTPHLFDAHAVRDVLQVVDNGSNDDDPTPLFLGFNLDEEYVYSLEGAIPALRAVDPLLFRSVMAVLYRASVRTMFIRLPDWFMYEFSCWYWDGEPNISDKDADAALKERFGDDTETRSAYLPSVVRQQLCPDDADPCAYSGGRWRDRGVLTGPELLRLRGRTKGMPRRVCTEVLKLRALLLRSRTRDLFHVSYNTNPVYGVCSVVVEDNEFIGDLLDNHFDVAGQCGDATTYSGFSRLAWTPKAIRRQYADLALAFRILSHLDRLLALVSHPI